MNRRLFLRTSFLVVIFWFNPSWAMWPPMSGGMMQMFDQLFEPMNREMTRKVLCKQFYDKRLVEDSASQAIIKGHHARREQEALDSVPKVLVLKHHVSKPEPSPFVPYTIKVDPIEVSPVPSKKMFLDYGTMLEAKHKELKNGSKSKRTRTYPRLTDIIESEKERHPDAKFEIFPVQILAHEKQNPFEKNMTTEDFAFYQNLIVKTERHPWVGFYVRTYKTIVARGEPPDFMYELGKASYEGSKYPFRQAEANIVANGLVRQLGIMKRLLVFTLTHYGRQGWNIDQKTGKVVSLEPAHLEAFVEDVILNREKYEKMKDVPEYISIVLLALKTMNNTTYQEVFRINKESGQEELLGLIGQTAAPYGVVEFFNLAATPPRWEARYGRFGSRFNETFYSSQNSETAPSLNPVVRNSEMRQESARQENDASLKPTVGSIFHWSLVDGIVPALPVENVSGGKPEARPWVSDALMDMYMGESKYERSDDPFRYSFLKMTGPFPEGILPDARKPIKFGVGEVVEPVKYVVNRSLRPIALRNLVNKLLMLELAKFLFSDEAGNDFDRASFNKEGRRIYTFFPEKSADIYIKRNFEKNPNVPAMFVDGVLFVRLGADISKFGEWLISLDAETSEKVFEALIDENEKRVWQSRK